MSKPCKAGATLKRTGWHNAMDDLKYLLITAFAWLM